ncbi:MAG: hypothetical protein WB774_01660, partial [Xanthobacteraceae bacterium]
LTAMEAAFALNVSGVDDNSAQPLYARQLYSHRDIRWNYRYRDITSLSAEGRLLLDYSLFHAITPEPDKAADQDVIGDREQRRVERTVI